MIVFMMKKKLEARIIDVETAFLHGKLDEEIYMECPQGMNSKDYECLVLHKTIYGLVQAARQWWKTFITYLRRIGFRMCGVDNCLLIRETNGGTMLLGLYVDDALLIGNKRDLDEVENLMRKEFVIKVDYDLNDYLSCEILFSRNKEKAWIGQPHMVNKLIKKFGNMVKDIGPYKTPGTPHNGIMRPLKMEDGITDKDKKHTRVEWECCCI